MQPEAQAALRGVWLQRELARYQQRSQTDAQNFTVWQQLGRIYWELGELEQALEAFTKAQALQPDDEECLIRKSALCLALGRIEELLATAVQLLDKAPQHADGLLYKTEALRQLGRLAEALEVSEALLELPLPLPQLLLALHNKVILLTQLQRVEEALALANQGLTIAPHDPIVRLDQVELLCQLARFAEALQFVDLAMSAPQTQFAAQCAKAKSLAILRRFDEADQLLNWLQDHYPHAVLEKKFEPGRLPDQTLPDSLFKRYTARGLYLINFFNAQAECDWEERDWVLANIEDLTADALRDGWVAGMEPHNLLRLPLDPALQLAVARAQAQAVDAFMLPVRQQLALQWSAAPQRLRIGYVSGDFGNHATAHLIRKLFQVHDREHFEVFGYTLRPSDGSHYRRDIAQACDHFVDLYALNNADAAAKIAADGIQILVDLHGYTRFARPELFALRPAPLQVTFLGYPGTLGADYIPHIIADQIVLPESVRRTFSEQPIYLSCYQVNDDEQPVADTGLSRSAVGLPESGFVYCCLNAPYKIEPEAFSIWMRVLQQVPGSVLWLLEDTPACVARLRKAAEERGIAPERLVFAPRLPKAEHLERYRLADLFMDTFTVNAHTGASDALWVGLPVLTVVGTNFQSRVCASLLSAIGWTEMIAEDREHYEQQAVAIASDTGWRERLQQCRQTDRLFSTERFARELEEALLRFWRCTAGSL